MPARFGHTFASSIGWIQLSDESVHYKPPMFKSYLPKVRFNKDCVSIRTVYQQEQCTNKRSISTMWISMISRTLKRRTSLLFVPVRTAVSMRARLRTRSASVTRIPTGEGRSRMTRNNVCFIGTSLPEAFRRPDYHHRETPGFPCFLGLFRQVMASLLATTPSTSPLRLRCLSHRFWTITLEEFGVAFRC